MRCVSYTRTTSCCRNNAVPVLSVSEQNDHIKAYAKSNGIRILKKYSDRKNDPSEIAEFEKMRLDGLNRTFDLLVFDSFWQCGKDIFTIIRVLKESFYPAGIHFAVAQEGFCSIGRGRDEVISYLECKWGLYHGHLMKSNNARNPRIHFVETYGYRYDREQDMLRIDEGSAEIVREIFSRLLQGELPSEISNGLTARGVENPGDYYCRTKGWKLRGDNRGWSAGAVAYLAKNPKYAGRWEFLANGKNYADDCEPIIDPDKYDEVQRILDLRRHHKKECNHSSNPFQKMMTDEETGAAVIMKKNPNTGRCDYHFKPRKPEGVRYERTCMDYDEAMAQIRSLLKREHNRAVAAAAYIDTHDIGSYKDDLIEEKRSPVPRLLSDLHKLSGKRLELDSLFNAGKIPEDEYLSETGTADADCRKVTEALSQIYEEIMVIEKAISGDNPWIRLFTGHDECHELTRSYFKRFCEHINIWRFEELRPVYRETEWRDRLPAYWMEAGDGTDQQTK